MVAPRVDRMLDLAAGEGRTLRLGIRLHIIARDTADEAWAEARRILDGMDPAAIAASQDRYARMESVGQARMASLHGGRTDGSRSRRTSGQESASSAKAPPQHWSGATKTSPSASPSTATSASTSSFSPATLTWRRPTGWANAFYPSSAGATGPQCLPRLLTSPLRPRRKDVLVSVLDEVLNANKRYASSFGAKSDSLSHQPAGSRFSRAWTPASTRPSTPASAKATPT